MANTYQRTSSLALTAALILATPVAVGGNQKVLLIGLDGVRADAMDAALSQGKAPNIQSLINTGLYSNRATTSDVTGSWGGWSDALRGVHRDEHGASHWSEFLGANWVYPPPSFQLFVENPNLFNRVESFNSNLNTASFITWEPLHNSMDSASASATVDRGADHRVFSDFFDPNQGVQNDGDEIVTASAVSYIGSNNPDVVFFYQADPDISGHGGGEFPGSFSPTSGNYLNEIEETDGHVGQVLDAIQNRPTFAQEEWLIVLTSDHGGNGNSHSRNIAGEREVPFVVSGYNVSVSQQRPDNNPMFVAPKLIDVVPTILDHLSIPTNDPAWDGLRGNVIGRSPSTQPAIATGTNLVFNGDAEFDRGFDGHNSNGALNSNLDSGIEGNYWDQDAGGWEDNEGRNSVTVMYYGSTGGYPAAGDPGPVNRGDNFFSAGIDGNSEMTQRIDVSSLTSEGLGYEIAAYLGGFAADDDRANFVARFLDAGGVEISRATLLGPDAAQRGNQTGLFLRSLSGALPASVDSIEFMLETSGNDGYADNLFFSITDTISLTGDLDSDGDIDSADWLLYAAGLGSAAPGETDLTGDGINDYTDFLVFKQVYEMANPGAAFADLSTTTPEPTSALLLSLAGLSILLTSPISVRVESAKRLTKRSCVTALFARQSLHHAAQPA